MRKEEKKKCEDDRGIYITECIRRRWIDIKGKGHRGDGEGEDDEYSGGKDVEIDGRRGGGYE